jgi:pimeloyl-ACP methyl ester carboxylesterase
VKKLTGILRLACCAIAVLAGCSDSTPSASPDGGNKGETAADAGTEADASTPVAIGSIKLHRDDLVFDALEAGPKDGELVLLLHGFPTTPIMYRPELTALAEAGYHAVAPLQRGYSSGARPSGDADYGVLTLADDVAAMADDLGVKRFHLVGHDWGGGIAWIVGATHADRLLSLTVVSTPHPEALRMAITDPAGDQARMSTYTKFLRADGAVTRLLADDAALLNVFYGHAERALELGTFDEVAVTKEAAELEILPQSEVDAYLDVLHDPAALDAALAYYRQNWGTLEDPAGDLSSLTISVPTLFVWGGKEAFLGRQAAEATGAFVKNAPYKFDELKDAGHWIPELFPDALTAALLDHLKESRGGDAL